MNILETIVGAQGGGAVSQLAAQFGLKPEQAQAAVAALMPALTNGLRRNISTQEGAQALASALGRGRHETYVDDPSTLARPETVQDGNAILGHLLGSKDASRQAAANAAQQTGIDPAILKRMLPLLATLTMGGLARQSRTGAAAPGTGGIGALLGSALDRDRDGNVADDVAGMLGGLLGRKR